MPPSLPPCEGGPLATSRPLPPLSAPCRARCTQVATSHPLYECVSAAVEEVTGVAPHVNPMHTSSDIRVPLVQVIAPDGS